MRTLYTMLMNDEKREVVLRKLGTFLLITSPVVLVTMALIVTGVLH